MDQHADHYDYPEETISFSQLYRVGRRAAPMVLLASAAAFLLILIVLLAVYLVAPSEEVASIRFRLDFQGAERGVYPNGTTFRSTDLVATPILRKVWTRNALQRFVDFDTFSSAVFVTESNDAIDQLSRDYRARLNDPKLSAVDRERLEREYELKVQSLGRSEYSLNYASARGGHEVPKDIVTDTLREILATWAEHTEGERGAVLYQVPVVSENVLPPKAYAENRPVIALDLMRSKIAEISRNIGRLRKIPGAEILRTRDERISLMEIELRLDDLIRLQIRPLISRIRNAGSIGDRQETIRFIESQLAHNRLRRDEAAARETTLRNSLSLYRTDQPADRTIAPTGGEAGETVMPQLGESFLDRIVDLAGQSADREYRQNIVDEVTAAALQVIPYETEIAYYEELLEEVRTIPEAGDAEEIGEELSRAYEDVQKAIRQVGEIYGLISDNLNTSANLYTVRGPVEFHESRGVSARRLALIGFLLWMIAVASILVWAFIRYWIEAEEFEERHAPSAGG